MWEVRKNPPGVAGQREGRHLFIQCPTDSDAEWLAEIIESATDTVVKLSCQNPTCRDVGGYIMRAASEARRVVHSCDTCGKPMLRAPKSPTASSAKVVATVVGKGGGVGESVEFRPNASLTASLPIEIDFRQVAYASPHATVKPQSDGSATVDMSGYAFGVTVASIELELKEMIANLDIKTVNITNDLDLRLGSLIQRANVITEQLATFDVHDKRIAGLASDIDRLISDARAHIELRLAALEKRDFAAVLQQVNGLRDLANGLASRISDLDKRTSTALSELRVTVSTAIVGETT